MLPGINSWAKRERDIVQFGGINYGEGAVDGELKESEGLSSREYPALTTRRGRRRLHICSTAPSALFAWNALVEVEGTTLYYDDRAGNRRNIGELEEGKKQFAVVANKLIVWPDKKVLDLSNPTAASLRDYKASASSAQNQNVAITTNSITFTPQIHVQNYSNTYRSQNWQDIGSCFAGAAFYTFLSYEKGQQRLSGASMPLWDCEFRDFHSSDYPLMQVGTKLAAKKSETGTYTPIVRSCKPANGYNNSAWKDLSDWDGEPTTDSVYILVTSITRTESTMDSQERCFVDWRVTCEVVEDGAQTNVGALFKVGDRVNVTGTRKASGVLIQSITSNSSGTTVTFTTSPFTAYTGAGNITISHDVPDFDFITAKDNRLWGWCNSNQTLYISAADNPMDFFDYAYDERGDSICRTITYGSAGDATAMCTYSNSVLIWKENMLYKVLGQFTSEYMTYPYDVSGVQAGCEKSQVIIGEVLYYLGREGVYAYAGDVPQLVSGALGDRRYSGGCAGTDGRRYYISMQDDDSGEWGLYCYDTLRGIWMREDGTEAADFARIGKSLYLHSRTDRALYELDTSEPEAVEWSAEFKAFDETTLHRKRYTRITLRLELDEGTTAKIETRADSGEWRQLREITATSRGTVSVPIAPMRCDRLSVRLSGKGHMLLRGMEREYHTKSEV